MTPREWQDPGRSGDADFVGRRREVAQVRRLLRGARLVTLTGVGGCGKTRLARRVADRLRPMYRDGVRVVDLAPLADPTLLDSHVAEALDIADRTHRRVSEMVLGYLANRNLLLVLDNCEHLLDSCAAFVDRALRASAELRVLCTSRQSLGVPGEHLFPVSPLAVPAPGAVGGGPDRYAALALFVRRARAEVPGFTLTARNRAAVAGICRRLDGLPLAIELAAACLRTHAVEWIESHLADRLDLFAGATSDPRHRTMRGTFDWSFALCAPAERLLWKRVSVFAGSFELGAAEWVCAGSGLPTDDLCDVVAGLVDKSVLIREEHAGLARYRLLGTVRRYGLDRLRASLDTDPVDEAGLRQRHRDWYLDLAERFDADWFGPRQPQWTKRLRAEHANLRAALGHCFADPDGTPAGVRLAGALAYFWFACGVLHEGRHWLRKALAADHRPSRDRLRALAAYSRVLVVQGKHAEAAACGRECLAQAYELDDALYIARGLNHVGASLSLGDDPVAALPLLEEAVTRYDGLAEPHPEVLFARIAMAAPLVLRGEPARAAALCADSRARCRARGDRWWLGHVLISSAIAAEELGDRAQARAFSRESLAIHGELDDPIGVAGALERLAWLSTADGDHERAARLLGAADRNWRQVGRCMYGTERWGRRHDASVAAARAALGDTGFDAEFRGGGALRPDRAIADALG